VKIVDLSTISGVRSARRGQIIDLSTITWP
jgi:hypothetical protein